MVLHLQLVHNHALQQQQAPDQHAVAAVQLVAASHTLGRFLIVLLSVRGFDSVQNTLMSCSADQPVKDQP